MRMSHGRHGRGLAAAFILVASSAWALLPGSTAAWSGGACPTSAGVTVVVDFTAFGGDVTTRCVDGAPGSGLATLADAGFQVEQVSSMSGFVCRIDGSPGTATESCASTPPADAYWAYWTAPRGGTWAYSPAGPAGSRPAQGTVEGWAFTRGNVAEPPSVPPPPVASSTTPHPTVAPTSHPTARPTPASTPIPTPAASVAGIGPLASHESPATATPERSPSPTALPSTGSAAMASERPSPAPSLATAEGPSGPDPGPIGTVAGIGLAAVIGGGALAVHRRSRVGADG